MQQKPEESSSPERAQAARPSTHLQRVLQASTVETARSPGEIMMPFFLALAETCWFNGALIGLASVDFLHTRVALLPFWGAPLLLCVSLWLFQRGIYLPVNSSSEQEQGTRVLTGNGLLFGTLAVLAVLLIWLRIYAGSYFLLDPRWLLSLSNDLLSLNDHFIQAAAILISAAYFCWRSSRLAQLRIEPGHIKRQIWIGLLILLASIMLRAGFAGTGGNLDDLVMILLPAAFLYFALSAHALARASFMRRAHPFGLEGTIATQERSMLSIIAVIGLGLLVLTLIGGVAFSAAFWSSLQPAGQVAMEGYTWLVDKVSLGLAWILQPLFWLITWIASLFHPTRRPTPPASNITPISGHHIAPTASPVLVFSVKVLLPLLILALLILLTWLTLRRRRRVHPVRRRANGDVHESVWSWKLFWNQFKALLAALFGRRKPAEDIQPTQDGELPTELAARTIREIYRALLKRAASAGYARRRNETPHEFRHRLNQSRPANNEPQLGQITDAYALTRYGGNVPDELELAGLRRSWQELEGKWQVPPDQREPATEPSP